MLHWLGSHRLRNRSPVTKLICSVISYDYDSITAFIMIRNRTNLSYRPAAMDAKAAAAANLTVSRETSRAARTARDMQQLCSFDV